LKQNDQQTSNQRIEIGKKTGKRRKGRIKIKGKQGNTKKGKKKEEAKNKHKHN
jgi:RNA-binding protein YlmH